MASFSNPEIPKGPEPKSATKFAQEARDVIEDDVLKIRTARDPQYEQTWKRFLTWERIRLFNEMSSEDHHTTVAQALENKPEQVQYIDLLEQAISEPDLRENIVQHEVDLLRQQLEQQPENQKSIIRQKIKNWERWLRMMEK